MKVILYTFYSQKFKTELGKWLQIKSKISDKSSRRCPWLSPITCNKSIFVITDAKMQILMLLFILFALLEATRCDFAFFHCFYMICAHEKFKSAKHMKLVTMMNMNEDKFTF